MGTCSEISVQAPGIGFLERPTFRQYGRPVDIELRVIWPRGTAASLAARSLAGTGGCAQRSTRPANRTWPGTAGETGTPLRAHRRWSGQPQGEDRQPLVGSCRSSCQRHRGSGPDQLVDGEERELWCYVLGLLDGGNELLAGECLELFL
jgi:hypothetical protein